MKKYSWDKSFIIKSYLKNIEKFLFNHKYYTSRDKITHDNLHDMILFSLLKLPEYGSLFFSINNAFLCDEQFVKNILSKNVQDIIKEEINFCNRRDINIMFEDLDLTKNDNDFESAKEFMEEICIDLKKEIDAAIKNRNYLLKRKNAKVH